jgi:hypothetical protein
MRFDVDELGRSIDFDIVLTPNGHPVTFGDTKEGTFAIRLASTLRVEGDVAEGTLLDSEGRANGAVWGKRARWVAANGPVQGEVVTVAILDHPENLRHPTWWHARKYGLVAANPFGVHDFEGQAEGAGDFVAEGPVRFRYRVLLRRGAATQAELDRAWRVYAEG